MMLRANWKPEPRPSRIGSTLVCEFAIQHEQLSALFVGQDSEIGIWLPALETHHVRETSLLVEPLVADPRHRARFPRGPVRIDDNVAPSPAGRLPELDEEKASRLRKRRVAESLWIQEIRSRRPIAMLVGEDAVEHEDLLPFGVIVRWETRVRLIAHDRRNLARLRRSDQVDSLAPDGTARA